MISILKQMLVSMQQYQKEQEKLIEQITEILKAHGVEIDKEGPEKEQVLPNGMEEKKKEFR